MRILLDTHVVLWWMSDDPSLSKAARAMIADPANTIFVSAVSTWEIWLKKSLGKLEIPEEFETRLAEEEFQPLSLTVGDTRRVAALPWHHRDPFDRMLVAQAEAASLTLLTADSQLIAYGNFVRTV